MFSFPLSRLNVVVVVILVRPHSVVRGHGQQEAFVLRVAAVVIERRAPLVEILDGYPTQFDARVGLILLRPLSHTADQIPAPLPQSCRSLLSASACPPGPLHPATGKNKCDHRDHGQACQRHQDHQD